MHPLRSLLSPHLALTVAAAATLALSAPSQGCLYLPDSDPTTGPGSTSPFGETNPADPNTANQALLFKVPAAQMPTQPVRIHALGFAAEATRTRQFGTITIRMGHGPNPTLDPLFSANMPGFTQLVMGASDWTWETQADQWSFIGLDTSFQYDPSLGDLVIQIIVGGGHSPAGSGPLGFHSDPTMPSVLQRAWRFQAGRGVVGTGAPKVKVCWDAHDLQTYPGGCVGSNGLTPRLNLAGTSQIGGQLTVGLRDAPTTSPGGVLLLGFRRRGLPLDLTGFGAPTCAVHPFFDFNIPAPFANGGIDFVVATPNNPNLVGLRLWPQWIVLDPGVNALGITMSTFGRILYGT